MPIFAGLPLGATKNKNGEPSFWAIGDLTKTAWIRRRHCRHLLLRRFQREKTYVYD